jgi:hypothetical protein
MKKAYETVYIHNFVVHVMTSAKCDDMALMVHVLKHESADHEWLGCGVVEDGLSPVSSSLVSFQATISGSFYSFLVFFLCSVPNVMYALKRMEDVTTW